MSPTFPPVPTSWNVTHGGCGVLLYSDAECSKPAGHYPATMHRAYDPSASGQWIEFDSDGEITARSTGSPDDADLPEGLEVKHIERGRVIIGAKGQPMSYLDGEPQYGNQQTPPEED